MVTILAVASLALAVVPAVMYWINVHLYRPAPQPTRPSPPVSILIPARNEERSIGAALNAALATADVEIEIIVLDDHSTDHTAKVVSEIVARDDRVRLVASEALPEGWCGKQFACWQLGRLASHPLLLFVDADVRLAPDGAARLAAFLDAAEADLVSGVPLQETGSWLERLVVPLIHAILLGYLPLAAMRWTFFSAFGAGCGQLFLVRRAAYEAIGGHSAIKQSLHDGITLPRAFRKARYRTDLCDATDLATCRMYHDARSLWSGLAKNAREGMAHPKAIIPWTILLFGGYILPVVLLILAPWLNLTAVACAGIALATTLAMRIDAAHRFQQSWFGAALHPVGMIVLLAIQWYAIVRAFAGRPVGWKGRRHPSIAAG